MWGPGLALLALLCSCFCQEKRNDPVVEGFLPVADKEIETGVGEGGGLAHSEGGEVGAVLAGSRRSEVTCPSDDVIRTLQRCRVKGQWVDCHR